LEFGRDALKGTVFVGVVVCIFYICQKLFAANNNTIGIHFLVADPDEVVMISLKVLDAYGRYPFKVDRK